ncbi:MAG: hypothetical protein GYA50_08670 [Eubacteriaceae bacterium]|nr:hypothetical protein [Eubacteriaceae bacterium]
MRVLILTGQFGMGHVCASEAVKQEIADSYPTAIIDIVDFLEFALPKFNTVIYKSFNFVVSKLPRLFNLLFDISDNSNVYPFKNFANKKIDLLINMYSPDFIISVSPLTSKYVSIYKDSKKLKDIPLFTLITDISYHSQWISSNTDAYFVACEEIKDFLVKKGINSEHIYISGIPVRQEFKVNAFSGAKGANKNILIMGGGIGLIPKCNDILLHLSQMSGINVTVIAGKNKRLYKSLKRKYKNIKIFGYTDNISQLMSSSDILISKPGGITLFEAINTALPIFIIKPTLAHEKVNAGFVEQNGIGKVIWNNNSDTYAKLAELIYDDNQLNIIKNQMRCIQKQTRKIDLCKIINDWSVEYSK